MKKLIFLLILLQSLTWAATQLTYSMNVNVTNNDIGNCNDSFKITAKLPSGWKVAYFQNPISLSAQTTVSDLATITVPKTTKSGTYNVSFTVTSTSRKSSVVNTTVTVF